MTTLDDFLAQEGNLVSATQAARQARIDALAAVSLVEAMKNVRDGLAFPAPAIGAVVRLIDDALHAWEARHKNPRRCARTDRHRRRPDTDPRVVWRSPRSRQSGDSVVKITRKQLEQWAHKADVGEKNAEELLRLAGHEIEPEADELTLLVREIGAALMVTDGMLWRRGDLDASENAEIIRGFIDQIRAYERRRILGGVEVEISPMEVMFNPVGDGSSYIFSNHTQVYLLLRRLTGAE